MRNEDEVTKERRVLLERLWMAELKRCIEVIENTPADQISAPMLNTVRAFLSDNQVTAKDLETTQRAVRAMARIVNMPFRPGRDDEMTHYNAAGERETPFRKPEND